MPAEELLGLDYVRHDANLPEVVGPQAERQFIAGVIAAFPDLHLQTEQLVAEDDLVVIRVTVGGTHRAEFMGVPPSDRRVKFQAVEIYRLSDAKIAEQRVVTDILGLLQGGNRRFAEAAGGAHDDRKLAEFTRGIIPVSFTHLKWRMSGGTAAAGPPNPTTTRRVPPRRVASSRRDIPLFAGSRPSEQGPNWATLSH
jgi:predicted ester cyclase